MTSNNSGGASSIGGLFIWPTVVAVVVILLLVLALFQTIRYAHTNNISIFKLPLYYVLLIAVLTLTYLLIAQLADIWPANSESWPWPNTPNAPGGTWLSSL